MVDVGWGRYLYVEPFICRFWCPTAIDAHGYTLVNQWGFCADTCPASTLSVRVHKVDTIVSTSGSLQLRTVGHFRQQQQVTASAAASDQTFCLDQDGLSVPCLLDSSAAG